MDEIGVDALRYSLARYPADSPLTLDVDEITKASSDNPVYYVQYAHARTCRMMENAADLGMALPGDDFDPSLLSHEHEGELLRALAEFPRVVASAAELREPHRVARYLEDTAAVFNRWYDTGVPDAAAGRRAGDRRQRGAPGAGRRRPARSWPTASACSASPRRSGCDGRADRPPGRLGARRRRAARAPLAA